MGLCRGTGLLNLRAFAGAAGWDRVVAALAPADRDALAQLHDAHWIDAALRDRVARVACEVLGGPGGALAFAAAAGRASAERNAGGSMRWFHRLIDPAFAIRNMTIYWRREQDGGRFEAELLEDRVIATLHDWRQERLVCHQLLHYLGRTLEFFGEVSALAHARCRSDGDPCCEFRARFRASPVRRPVEVAPIPALPEALAALRELGNTGDLGVMCAAIRRLLGDVIGARGVELVVPASAAPRGEPGERRRRFVLEQAGVAVGWIELEPPADRAAAALIEELVPWLGLVLARASTAPVPPEEDRLEAASRRFRLTRRELDVLGRVAQGRSNKETANELGISEATVEVHVTSILRKCGVDGRGALIARFWRLDAG